MSETEEKLPDGAVENADEEWADDLSWPDSSEMSQEEPENPDSQDFEYPEYDDPPPNYELLPGDELPDNELFLDDDLQPEMPDAADALLDAQAGPDSAPEEVPPEVCEKSPAFPARQPVHEMPGGMDEVDNSHEVAAPVIPEAAESGHPARFLAFAGLEMPQAPKPSPKRKRARGAKSPDAAVKKSGKSNKKAQIREDQHRLF